MLEQDNKDSKVDRQTFHNQVRSVTRRTGLRVVGAVAESITHITGADALTTGSYQLPNDAAVVVLQPCELVVVGEGEAAVNTYPATATIAAFTLTLPQSPEDGQRVTLIADGAVTALTMACNASHSIRSGETALTLNERAQWMFFGTTWFRVG